MTLNKVGGGCVHKARFRNMKSTLYIYSFVLDVANDINM